MEVLSVRCFPVTSALPVWAKSPPDRPSICIPYLPRRISPLALCTSKLQALKNWVSTWSVSKSPGTPTPSSGVREPPDGPLWLRSDWQWKRTKRRRSVSFQKFSPMPDTQRLTGSPLGTASAQTVSASAYGPHQREHDSVSPLKLFKAYAWRIKHRFIYLERETADNKKHEFSHLSL